MNTWIMSSRPGIYDHAASFEKHGFIDWKQKNHFQIGDLVFIRNKNPETGVDEVEFVGVVERIDIPFDEATDDTEFWTSGVKPVEEKYFRLRLITCARGCGLTRDALIAHGMKSSETIQSPKRLNKLGTGVEEFALGILNGILSADPYGSNEMVGYPEGAKTSVVVNRYERDPRNRKACIDHYGCRCRACGMDFGERYGHPAAGFIHVHHIVPVSELGDSYVIDPVNDLIPLCPNCHAMVHYLGITFEVLRDQLGTDLAVFDREGSA